MPTQGDLFAPRAHARRTDPKTSHAAAASIARDLTRLEERVFAVIRAASDAGSTLDEVCAATGLDKVSASPRFRPLGDMGKISVKRNEQGLEVTRIGRAGRQQQVWIANR